jgi:hypothetical protein
MLFGGLSRLVIEIFTQRSLNSKENTIESLNRKIKSNQVLNRKIKGIRVLNRKVKTQSDPCGWLDGRPAGAGERRTSASRPEVRPPSRVAFSSGAVAFSSGAVVRSSGAVAVSSGAVAVSSGAVAVYSGAVAVSSGVVAVSSGAVDCSSDGQGDTRSRHRGRIGAASQQVSMAESELHLRLRWTRGGGASKR